MDAVVERARRNQKPVGLDPEYDVVREHFDHLTYLLQLKDLQTLPQLDPIEHFMAEGQRSMHSPDVNFAMKSYLDRNPHRRHGTEQTPYSTWLTEGRARGEIGDPAYGIKDMAPILGLTPEELVGTLADLRTDLTERLRHGVLGEQIAKATAIEPLIGAVWASTVHPRIQPLNAPEITRQTTVLHDCQTQAGFRRARLVFVINRPRWGSGRRIEGHVVHALADRLDPADVVVVYTDEGGTTPEGRFPEGVREVDFARAARGLSPAHAARTLVELLRSFKAEAILNINSRVFYDALGPYGKALAASERVFPVMFCNEQLSQGNWGGWSLKHYYRVNEITPGIITDSEYLKDELTQRHLLGEADRAKLHVLRAPVQPEIPVAPAPVATPGRRPQVFWAGRWDRQKRIDLVLEIARSMPDVDFRLWGEKVLHGDPISDVPANVTLEGRYAAFADLDLGSADAWLYTSAWDGVPQLLLEVAMTGVPIVASVVGGVGELLPDGEAWPVRDVDDPAAYAAAIRDVLADPQDARKRSLQLRERLVEERSEKASAAAAAALLLKEDA
jgi:glycosyltransferase involved in cell wall biosynthesis